MADEAIPAPPVEAPPAGELAPPQPTLTQEELNLRAYERVFKQSMESAWRILGYEELPSPVDPSVRAEVHKLATTLFERYFEDQVKLGEDTRKAKLFAPFIKGLVAALERRGLYL